MTGWHKCDVVWFHPRTWNKDAGFILRCLNEEQWAKMNDINFIFMYLEKALYQVPWRKIQKLYSILDNFSFFVKKFWVNNKAYVSTKGYWKVLKEALLGIADKTWGWMKPSVRDTPVLLKSKVTEKYITLERLKKEKKLNDHMCLEAQRKTRKAGFERNRCQFFPNT